jgi:hypothetical protein
MWDHGSICKAEDDWLIKPKESPRLVCGYGSVGKTEGDWLIKSKETPRAGVRILRREI